MKYLLILLLVLSFTTASFCQERDEETPRNGFKKENLFFGGNLGLTFGSYTFINVSPQVGYHVSKNFDLGLGPNFQYVSQKLYDYNGVEDSKQTLVVYGANLFTRFYPFKQGFIQVQPEYNWISGKYKYYNAPSFNYSYKTGAPSLLLGIGANLNGLLISLMYDVVQDKNSPYSDRPFVNFGYVF